MNFFSFLGILKPLEMMARAYNASIFPSNPRDVFGLLPLEEESNSNVLLTEILFKEEYDSLPATNVGGPDNNVHQCTRQDQALLRQMVQFINNGTFMDVCANDGCVREKSDC